MSKKLLLLFLSVALAGFGGELLTRILGHRPYEPYDLEIAFNPTPFAVPHQQLGYMIRPGKFEVQLKNGLTWTATHDAKACRITSSQTLLHDSRDKLFVYGCSVAYGYGVADAESFPYVLQQKLPNLKVENFAVPGFAQTQAYLQLKQTIELGEIPKIVVLTYASFHDIRNTLCRERRKDIYPYNRRTSIDHIMYPVARYVQPDSYSISYEPLRYREWPLMRNSALVHLLETWFNEYEVNRKRSHEVSKNLIKAIHALCRQHNIQLIVAGIQKDALTQEMLAFSTQQGIGTVDLSFDSNDRSYTLLPLDPHPSAKGHAYFAEKMFSYLAGRN